MRLAKLGALCAVCVMPLVAPDRGMAQYRPDAAPVLESPKRPPPPRPYDPVPAFKAAYERAGRPRVALLWNRLLDDQVDTPSTRFDLSTTTRSAHSSELEERTAGDAGDSTFRERNGSFSESRLRRQGIERATRPQRETRFSERDAALLLNAFSGEFARGGLQFVDRDLAIRATAASRHRDGGDPQLIETDAITGFADLLMEVLLVPDPEAPLAYGFDVRLKNLRTGQQVLSVYSQGRPGASPAQGRWEATSNGFEYRVPEAAAPSVQEIGSALAHDVMTVLETRRIPLAGMAR
jgi:hypothetical protein